MKKNIITKILLACAALCATSCMLNIKPYYTTDDVTLEMKVAKVGAGFCHVKVDVQAYGGISDEAWYLLGVSPEQDCPKADQEFMDWAVRNAKEKYQVWRQEQEKNNPVIIADFASHSLKYGDTDTFFNYLEAGSDYVVYCFVMDPETEKPVGKLYKEKIRTEYVSKLNVDFDYRIKGYWDYIYPKDKKSGDLVSDIPWIAKTADSLDIRKSGVEIPYEYFMNIFDKKIEDRSMRILYGMYAYNNDGLGDMGEAVCFEQGHTYYTFIATFDGWLADFAQYKFTWTGPDMQIVLTQNDNCYGLWSLD